MDAFALVFLLLVSIVLVMLFPFQDHLLTFPNKITDRLDRAHSFALDDHLLIGDGMLIDVTRVLQQ